MKLDDLKEEYPKMPKEIRDMIENEVKDQMIRDKCTQIHSKKNKRFTWKRVAAIAAIATLAIGTTTYAGVMLYQWRMEKVGKYGLKAGIVTNSATETGTTGSAPDQIPELSIKATYLPEGMLSDEEMTGKPSFSFENNRYMGGISIMTVVMDEKISPSNLPVSDTNVTASGTINVNGKQAIYIDQNGSLSKIYIAYPEYWQILEVFVGDDITKEETIKILDNLEVKPTGKVVPFSKQSTWSEELNEKGDPDAVDTSDTNEKIEDMHKIGDPIQLETYADTTTKKDEILNCIQGKVTDVQVVDDLSLLDDSMIDSDLKEALDKNGKLKQNEISYYKSGDGVNNLDTLIDKQKVNQKLVYVTVEYSNMGNEELKNVLFNGDFVGLIEKEDTYTRYDRAKCDNNDETDFIKCSSIGGFSDMAYYDVHSGDRNNNYIPSIKPGESVTVHFAQVENEDELDKMYFSLQDSQAKGYVDIRQK